jgi:hypothetical protein
MKHFYELTGHRENGEVYTSEILGKHSEAEAKRLAQYYATLWQHSVTLYRVPALNPSSVPWAETDMQLIDRVLPRKFLMKAKRSVR